MKPSIPPSCVLLLVAATISSCDRPAVAAKSQPKVEDSLRRRVGFEPAKSADRAAVLTLPAEVVLEPGARFSVGPPVEGRIVTWAVALGDTVKAGQPIAEMLSPGLADLLSRVTEL